MAPGPRQRRRRRRFQRLALTPTLSAGSHSPSTPWGWSHWHLEEGEQVCKGQRRQAGRNGNMMARAVGCRTGCRASRHAPPGQQPVAAQRHANYLEQVLSLPFTYMHASMPHNASAAARSRRGGGRPPRRAAPAGLVAAATAHEPTATCAAGLTRVHARQARHGWLVAAIRLGVDACHVLCLPGPAAAALEGGRARPAASLRQWGCGAGCTERLCAGIPRFGSTGAPAATVCRRPGALQAAAAAPRRPCPPPAAVPAGLASVSSEHLHPFCVARHRTWACRGAWAAVVPRSGQHRGAAPARSFKILIVSRLEKRPGAGEAAGSAREARGRPRCCSGCAAGLSRAVAT